jgi:uncharacterized lipoprotein YehR (DUF1307 family)
MKNKLISLFIAGVVGLSLIGCANKETQYKTVNGTISDLGGEKGFKANFGYIVLKTDSGDIKFSCPRTLEEHFTKGTKVKISYGENFYTEHVEIGE